MDDEMPITPLPEPPSRADAANFAQRGDAFMAALPTFATEANALQADVNAKQTTASAAAVTATEQAGIATTKANQAGAAAGAAADSESAAADSATEALGYRNAAASSASAAADSEAAAAASAASVDAKNFSTDHYGSTAPAITWPGMTWADEGGGWLLRRDPTDMIWLPERPLFTPISPVGAFKNKLINGVPWIWQRGTVQNSGVSGYGSADRWGFSQVGGGTRRIIKSQLGLTGDAALALSGMGRVPVALTEITGIQSGASAYIYQQQKIEGVHTLQGRRVTLSFWLWGQAGGEQVALEVLQWFGSGGSPSPYVSIPLGKFTVAQAGVSQFEEVSFDLPSTASAILGSNADDSLNVIFWQSAGSDHDARTSDLGPRTGNTTVFGVQLEAGNYATAFEERPLGVELMLCQRYFRTFGRADFYNMQNNSTARSAVFNFPSSMRVVPSDTKTFGGGDPGTVNTEKSVDYLRYSTANSATGTVYVINVALDAEL